MQVENTEAEVQLWAPIQQLGTPWVENAEDHVVEIIFWICVVQLFFGALSGLNTCKNCESTYSEVEQDEEGAQVQIEVSAESSSNYMMNILIILIPILGILAVKLDCLEVLKVRYSPVLDFNLFLS